MNLVQQYKHEGYCIIRDAVSQNMIQHALLPIKKMTDRIIRAEYVNSLAACARLMIVRDLFCNIFIEDFLDEIGISTPLVHAPVVTIMNRNTIPDIYYGTSAHQDWASVQGSLDMATAWVALTDAKVGNYPLEVVPGSHLDGLKDGVANGSVLEIQAGGFIPVDCNAGDVVIFSGFMVHRTGSGSGYRVAASQRYENAAEPSYIERGYPCAQKRVVERELKWKPTVEEVQNALEKFR